MPNWIVNALALVGALSMLFGAGYLLHRSAKRSQIEWYLWGGVAVTALSAIVALLIASLPQGDSKAALSTMFVGALATIGWVYTLINLEKSSSLSQKAIESQIVQFVEASNKLASGLEKLGENTADFVNLVERLELKFAPSLAATATKIEEAARVNVDEMRDSRRKELTIELIINHATSTTIRTHRDLISRHYPMGTNVPESDVRAIVKDWTDPSKYHDGNVPVMYAIQAILNYFDLVAKCYQDGMLDESLMSYFKALMPSTVRKFKAVIDDRRHSPGMRSETWKNLIDVVAKWESGAP